MKEPVALPTDPADAEDFCATAEGLDRGQRARLIRTTRTTLGLSQTEFAGRFRVPVGRCVTGNRRGSVLPTSPWPM